MKTRLTRESLAEFASAHQPPCLSLYHRHIAVIPKTNRI